MIGQGVYKLSEVAALTGLPPSTVRSWFKPRSDGRGLGPVLTSDFPPAGDDFAVSFLNLIDALVGKFFRDAGVRPPVIRQAFETMKVDLGVEHPFAHSELYTDGRHILRRTADQVGDAELNDVLSRQAWFSEFCKHLGGINYSQRSKMAETWDIAKGVVVNPRVAFGKPVVAGRGTTTFVLARQFEANQRDEELVADLYAVSVQDVRNAVAFEAGLSGRRAA